MVEVLFALFSDPKKYCLNTSERGVFQKFKTFKCFCDPKSILERKQQFCTLKRSKVFAELLPSWKKGFEDGEGFASKTRNCKTRTKRKYVKHEIWKLDK